jgi:serine/threonine-protein kinase
LIGTVLADRYRIEKLLGAGGMGSVYRAQHVHMRKAVAIKVLHKEMTYLPEVVARFEREAVAAARIEHPNVANATDFGRLPDGSFYLVLEYVEGKSLRAVLKAKGPMATPRALHVTRQIADALSAAHAAGVVHRDLKPDNVMLLERESDRELVKVLDFGIAKLNTGDSKEQLTQLGSVFGTPEYMAPEQAQGIEVDARADLYTVGILLYEMLAAITPFNDDDMVVVLTRTLTMDPPPLPPRVEPSVAALVMQLLQKNPSARIQTAAELVQRIDALLGQVGTPAPVSVGTPSPSRASVELGDTVLHMHPPASVGVASTAAMSAATTPSVGGTWARLTARISALGNAAPDLTRNIRLGGQPVPLWALVGTGAVMLVGGLMFVIGLAMSPEEGDPPLPSHAGAAVPRAEKPRDPELQALIERAETGDRTALASLQARPEKGRSAAEWRALARGQAKIQSFPGSMSSYKQALLLDGRLAADSQLLRDVRAAAELPESADAALALAASLGQKGGDLLFDVWETHRKTPNMAAITKVAKQHLESNAVRAKASPALLILLDLWLAKSCGSYKQLLPRVSQFADARAVGKIKSLQSGRGCGFLGFGDCFPCLRGNKDLSNALKAAESRPVPSLF